MLVEASDQYSDSLSIEGKGVSLPLPMVNKWEGTTEVVPQCR